MDNYFQINEGMFLINKNTGDLLKVGGHMKTDSAYGRYFAVTNVITYECNIWDEGFIRCLCHKMEAN